MQCLDNSFARVHDLYGRNTYVPEVRYILRKQI